MNIIVLVKQVPDVSQIPEEAWDREKGTLRRGLLENVFNPLDIQALTFAGCLRVQGSPAAASSAGRPGRIVCLSMGPLQAQAVLQEAIARGADEAVLLTDVQFAGSDTGPTAYTLAQGIRKIARDIFRGDDYIVVAGMQSADGDTAQVPGQVAEELGIEHVAYARGFERSPAGELIITRIAPGGLEAVQPAQKPFLVTVSACMEPAPRSFWRACSAGAHIHVWDARAIEAMPERLGARGSRTWVSRIFSLTHERAEPCGYPQDMDVLLDRLADDLKRERAAVDVPLAAYDLKGRTGKYHGEVWVYAQTHEGRIAPVTFELIAKARELAAGLHEKVAAVLAGDNVGELAAGLLAAGADKVYVAEDGLLKDFLPWPYKKAVAALVLQHRPQIMLLGATPLGRELAPRVAYATGSGLTADCTGLEICDHEDEVAVLKQSRPALGGNIMAAIMTRNAFCQMATVRPGVFKPAAAPGPGAGVIVRAVPDLSGADVRSRIVGRTPQAGHVDLAGAQIIVAGGRGLGSKDSFERQLRPLADALARWSGMKVEIAGSRMAVEDGFIGHERQVGQTGQSVAPKLYVAVGISGAVQHITGMHNARTVLAINKDPQAPVYRHADHGVIAASEDALPRLIEALHRRSL